MQKHEGTSTPLRILVVERNQEVCELFQTLFGFMEHRIEAVPSPVDALLLAKAYLPDIIYTSVVFDDIHGFELAARLRQMPELNNTVLIALTGMYFPGIQYIARAVGFDDYMCKPVKMDSLMRTIDELPKYRQKQVRAS